MCVAVNGILFARSRLNAACRRAIQCFMYGAVLKIKDLCSRMRSIMTNVARHNFAVTTKSGWSAHTYYIKCAETYAAVNTNHGKINIKGQTHSLCKQHEIRAFSDGYYRRVFTPQSCVKRSHATAHRRKAKAKSAKCEWKSDVKYT